MSFLDFLMLQRPGGDAIEVCKARSVNRTAALLKPFRLSELPGRSQPQPMLMTLGAACLC